jgi:hypothetical protein
MSSLNLLLFARCYTECDEHHKYLRTRDKEILEEAGVFSKHRAFAVCRDIRSPPGLSVPITVYCV